MDYDVATPAEHLGFLLKRGPIPIEPPVLSEPQAERLLGEIIRQKALVHVDLLSEKLYNKAIAPTATARVIADALDANYKLSGLAAKNVAKEIAGMVSITINIPKTEGTIGRTISVDAKQVDEIPSIDDIGDLLDNKRADG